MKFYDQPTDRGRRVFIKGVGNVSAGLLLSTLLGGCEQIRRLIEERPLRRRLRTGSAEVDNTIEIYKDAVLQMQALPSSDPRSWAAQAAIHGSNPGGFNFCEHGTPHFFSWHRAYLFHFERICRALTGEGDFALPYWNWQLNPALHPEFTATNSPLFLARNNTTVAGLNAFSSSTLNTILSDSNFFTLSTQLEGTPHNTGHSYVGGTMGSFGSALDPLFWMHHCMVDYCWAKWNIELENDNPNEPSWTGTSWNHFTDPNGDEAEISAGATVFMPLLSYRYETSTVGGFPAALALTQRDAEDLRRIERRLREGADVRFDIRTRVPIVEQTTLTIQRPFSAQTSVTADDFAALVEAEQRTERVFVNVAYAQLPPASDFFVRVFINRPDADARTSTDDPHYAGSFAFFGTHIENDHHQGPHHTEFLVNITGTLQRLRRLQALRHDEPLSVQLVAVPMAEQFIRPDAMLILRSVSLLVSPVSVREREDNPAAINP